MDPLGDQERALVRAADAELPTLALAETASRVLADLIVKVPVAPSARARSSQETNHQAIWFMAVIAFRAARAAIWVTSAGYEDQAIGYMRLIDELHNRAQKVRADPSGRYAREWIAGKSLGKGAKLAGQEMWEMLSGPVHANAKAVFDWLAIEQEDGSTKVVLGPERRPEVSNSNLTYIAGELRDMAAVLSAAAGRQSEDLAELTVAIKAAQVEHWGPDLDGAD